MNAKKEIEGATDKYLHCTSMDFHFKALIEPETPFSSPTLKHIFTFEITLYAGWSSWSKWSPCSKSCKGIQQRYRHCLTNQQNKASSRMATNERAANEMDKSDSAAKERQLNQQLCNGYNIEQRECNLFECKGRRVNELLAVVPVSCLFRFPLSLLSYATLV